MNERDLFLSALEIEDPAARQAHLQSACVNDAPLLVRVESLLASHENQSLFLQTPAVEQLGDGTAEGTAATIYVGNGSTQDDETDEERQQPDNADEIPLGFLQPSGRPGSLGRLDHYEILEVVGRGAFGTVLRAFDDKLQRVVAIKVMAPELAATSPARKRFLREARASAAVRHEHVVSVYDVGEKPIPYLVMEFVPGQTLQQRLDQRGPLDVASVLRFGIQIADGLAAAHAQDLIHRDIKPGNILLETGVQDRVKITDFGLARAADDASMTQSGMIAGTPMYMAPEQALGQKLDQRADLFSLGSVLYQMVSGRPPFRAPSTLAVLKRVTEETPRPIQEIIPETPQWLCNIIAKLHAKNPDERYQSAREIADVLTDCEAQLKAHAGLKDFSRIPTPKAKPRVGCLNWATAVIPVIVLMALSIYGLVQVIQSFVRPGGRQTAASTHGQQLAGWGTAVDPKRDCTIKLDGNVLAITVPGGEYNLNPTRAYNDVSAPRVLQKAEGDFQLQVRLEAFGPPDTGVPGIPKNYNGAGLLLWQDEKNFVRFLRSANGGTKNVFIHLECFQDARNVATQAINIANQPTVLRVVRTGGGYRFSYSADGTKWTEVRAGPPVRLADKLQVGMAATNTTDKPFSPRFSQLQFQPGKASPPRAVAPLNTANDQARQEEWVKRFNALLARDWNPTAINGLKAKVDEPSTDHRATYSLLIALAYQNDVEQHRQYRTRHVQQFPTFEDWGKHNSEGIADLAGRSLNAYLLLPVATEEFPSLAAVAELVKKGPRHSSSRALGYLAYRSGRFADAARHFAACQQGFLQGTDPWFEPLSACAGFELAMAQAQAGDHAAALAAYRASENLMKPVIERLEKNPESQLLDWMQAVVSWREALGVLQQTGTFPPPAAVAPFDADQAKAHQRAWSKHLGVPVEYTNTIDMKFRLIPPGEFTMGSSDEEIQALIEEAKAAGLADWMIEEFKSEYPQQRTTVEQPFYLGAHEVTRADFRQFIAATGYQTDGERSGDGGWAHFEGQWVRRPEHIWKMRGMWTISDDQPVVQVSWNDAQAYCEWLSGRDGRRYALPTEVQWEFAVRAGTRRLYGGSELSSSLDTLAWTKRNFPADRTGGPQSVGLRAANAFGLYDMQGNVWEWCAEWQRGHEGERRVLRGGGWHTDATRVRPANRGGGEPNKAWDSAVGFRVAIVGDLTKTSPPVVPQPAKLRSFTPGKDELPTALRPEGKEVVTVDGDAWRIENSGQGGNFNVVVGQVLENIPQDGVLIFRAKVKVEAIHKMAWGSLGFGGANHRFISWDEWPDAQTRYDGKDTQWVEREVRHPVAECRKSDPPAIYLYAGMHADGVVWLKDVELLHLPAK